MIGFRMIAGGAILVASLVAQGPANAAGPAEIRKMLETEYGVEVLGLRRIELRGRKLFAVRVLKSGVDYNDAWQVNELLVDPVSGRLLPVAAFEAGAPAEPLADKSVTRILVPGDGRSIPVRQPPQAGAPEEGGQNRPPAKAAPEAGNAAAPRSQP